MSWKLFPPPHKLEAYEEGPAFLNNWIQTVK